MVEIPAFVAAWGVETVTSLPYHNIEPSSGQCTPAITLTKVFLPAQF